jgi:hypothetical protein
MRSRLIRLYPRQWRERYGDEFAAVLDERPLGPFDVADVVLGALDAHLHLRGLGAASEHGKGFSMSLRIGGYAAIAGGIVWLTAFVAASTFQENVWMGVLALALGSALLLLALVGLSAFQAREHPRLIWAAFIIPALGACVALIGLVAMAVLGDRQFVAGVSAWYVWSFGTLGLIVGSALFGIATWRARTLARPASASLAAGGVIVVLLLFGMLPLAGLLPDPLPILLTAAGGLLFAGGWVGLGLSALRIHGPRSVIEGAS